MNSALLTGIVNPVNRHSAFDLFTGYPKLKATVLKVVISLNYPTTATDLTFQIADDYYPNKDSSDIIDQVRRAIHELRMENKIRFINTKYGKTLIARREEL